MGGMTGTGGFTYKNAGVDIVAGDTASEIMYNAARLTWNQGGKFGRILVPNDDFSGIRYFDVSNLPRGTICNLNFDGVGTKMRFAERIGKRHETVACDLFAMVCDDAARDGVEPVAVGSVLDVNSLSAHGAIETVSKLAAGMVAAATRAGVRVVNGEIAELGARVQGDGPFAYNWCAGLLWMGNKRRILTGKSIREGDAIVGFRERGFRSNGLSLVYRILKSIESPFARYDFDEGKIGRTLCEQVLTPSTIYCRALTEMRGGAFGSPKVVLHGAAHITGGGIPGKLGRLLKRTGLGADIVPFNPPEVMTYVQKLGNVTDEEAYRTWNMGQGFLTIMPQREIGKSLEIAEKYGIEATVEGEISSTPGIRISSRGVQDAGRLVFEDYLND